MQLDNPLDRTAGRDEGLSALDSGPMQLGVFCIF